MTVRTGGFQPLFASLPSIGAAPPAAAAPPVVPFGAVLDAAFAGPRAGAAAGPALGGVVAPVVAVPAGGASAPTARPLSALAPAPAAALAPQVSAAPAPVALGTGAALRQPPAVAPVGQGAGLSGLPVSTDAWVAALGVQAPVAPGPSPVAAVGPRPGRAGPADPAVASVLAPSLLTPAPLTSAPLTPAAPLVAGPSPAPVLGPVAPVRAPALRGASLSVEADVVSALDAPLAGEPSGPGARAVPAPALISAPFVFVPQAAAPAQVRALSVERAGVALEQQGVRAVSDALAAWVEADSAPAAGADSAAPAAPVSSPVASAPVLRAAPASGHVPAPESVAAAAGIAVGPGASVNGGAGIATGGSPVPSAAPVPEEPMVIHTPSTERLEVDLREGDITLRFTVARGEDDALHVDLHAPRSVIEAMGELQSDLDSSFAEDDLDLGAFTAHADEDDAESAAEGESSEDDDPAAASPGSDARTASHGGAPRRAAPDGTARLIDRLV